MNHFIQRMTIFFTITAACPAADAYAAYLLELVNGNAIAVSYFWEERGEIKFCAHGGVMGISRDRIRKIRFCDSPPDLFKKDLQPTIAFPIAPVIIHSGTKRRSNTSDIKKKDAGTMSTVEDMKRRQSDLEMIRDEALQRLRNATKNKDAAGKKTAMRETAKASHEIVELIELMKQTYPDLFED